MSKTTGALAFSSAVNFYEISKILDYCEKHSSKETYSAVKKSVKKTIISILILLVAFIAIFAFGIIHFDKKIDSHTTSNNITYSHEKIGHVGNGVVWYIDNVKYEIDISDFGYDINNYEYGTDFNVYLDENHKVVDVNPIIKGNSTAADNMAWWLVGSLITICIILIGFAIWIRRSKSNLNPGREYFAFVTWLNNKTENEDWYNGYNN